MYANPEHGTRHIQQVIKVASLSFSQDHWQFFKLACFFSSFCRHFELSHIKVKGVDTLALLHKTRLKNNLLCMPSSLPSTQELPQVVMVFVVSSTGAEERIQKQDVRSPRALLPAENILNLICQSRSPSLRPKQNFLHGNRPFQITLLAPLLSISLTSQNSREIFQPLNSEAGGQFMQSDPGRGKATETFSYHKMGCIFSFIEVRQPQALDIWLHSSVHSTRRWS